MKIKTEKEIEKKLKELEDEGHPRFSCNMQYEYSGTIDALRWVLGKTKYLSAGHR